MLNLVIGRLIKKYGMLKLLLIIGDIAVKVIVLSVDGNRVVVRKK